MFTIVVGRGGYRYNDETVTVMKMMVVMMVVVIVVMVLW